jgi:hypothetical protein
MNMIETGDQLLSLGYEPIPCYEGTKRPIGLNWPDGNTIGKWQKAKGQPFLLGILTRKTPGVDIDCYDEQLADELQALAEEVTASKPPVRIGQPPKRALLFRGGGFKKLTMSWEDTDGVCHKIEILADGAQLIAYGIHPDTHQPYVWDGRGEPATIPQAQLPHLSLDEAVLYMRLARAKLRERGIEPKTFSGPGLDPREAEPEGCSNNDLRSALVLRSTVK